MTVSETLEKSSDWCSEHSVNQRMAPTLAQFADSLTAELQKENARLREALEKIVLDCCGCGKSDDCERGTAKDMARVALSKEKE